METNCSQAAKRCLISSSTPTLTHSCVGGVLAGCQSLTTSKLVLLSRSPSVRTPVPTSESDSSPRPSRSRPLPPARSPLGIQLPRAQIAPARTRISTAPAQTRPPHPPHDSQPLWIAALSGPKVSPSSSATRLTHLQDRGAHPPHPAHQPGSSPDTTRSFAQFYKQPLTPRPPTPRVVLPSHLNLSPSPMQPVFSHSV